MQAQCLKNIVETSYEHINFSVCGFQVFFGKARQRALLIDGMHNRPVHHQAVDTVFQRQLVEFEDRFIAGKCKPECNFHFNICEGMIVFIGNKSGT